MTAVRREYVVIWSIWSTEKPMWRPPPNVPHFTDRTLSFDGGKESGILVNIGYGKTNVAAHPECSDSF